MDLEKKNLFPECSFFIGVAKNKCSAMGFNEIVRNICKYSLFVKYLIDGVVDRNQE